MSVINKATLFQNGMCHTLSEWWLLNCSKQVMKQYNIRNIYAQRVTKVLLFIALSKPVQHTFIQMSFSKAWHCAGIEGKLDFVVQNNKTGH